MSDIEEDAPVAVVADRPQPLYDTRALAERLGVTVRTAQKLMREDGGVIPSFRVGPGGRSLRAHPEDVEEYIARCRGGS